MRDDDSPIGRSTHSQSATDTIDPSVLNAVVSAYYTEGVKAGPSARGRAQASQSAATVFVALLFALLTSSAFESSAGWAKVGALLAALFWALAAVLYMHAVGQPHGAAGQQAAAKSGDDLVRTVLGNAKSERDAVDRWLKRANLSAVVGLALTLTSLMGMLFWNETEWKMVTFPTGLPMAILDHACAPSEQDLFVDGQTLNDDMIRIRVQCPGEPANAYYVEKSRISGLVVKDG